MQLNFTTDWSPNVWGAPTWQNKLEEAVKLAVLLHMYVLAHRFNSIHYCYAYQPLLINIVVCLKGHRVRHKMHKMGPKCKTQRGKYREIQTWWLSRSTTLHRKTTDNKDLLPSWRFEIARKIFISHQPSSLHRLVRQPNKRASVSTWRMRFHTEEVWFHDEQLFDEIQKNWCDQILHHLCHCDWAFYFQLTCHHPESERI